MTQVGKVTQPYYLGDNPSRPVPFDGVMTVSHYIMPNFATMDWHQVPREKVIENIHSLQDPGGNLNDRIMMYIHVPYCKSFCHYCNFNRFHYPKQDSERLERYTDYLIKEIDWYMRQPYVQAREFTAIYVGGGSPSTLPTSAVERLSEHLSKVVPNFGSIEKSFTGEPRTLRRPGLLDVLKDHGWNRITFGIETLNEKIHRKIGRLDTREDVDAVFDRMRDLGYTADTCVDMMYDLPGQTLEGFQDELSELLSCYDPSEIDLFTTIYLPYRPLHKLIMDGRVEQPGSPWQLLAMREHLYDTLSAAGYHNTIAETWSKTPHRSQYQTAHCARQDIIGVGCAARGNVRDMVSINPEKVDDWQRNVDEQGASTETLQSIGYEGVLDRIMVMFPRYKSLGKELLADYAARVDEDAFERVRTVLDGHLAAGVIEDEGDRFTVNKLGVIWHGNLQTDYLRHTLNTKGEVLMDHLTEARQDFDNENRFDVTPETVYIKEHDAEYPRLMK
ncbi:coproporphyrinogen-III oxidase family protein [Streptomyces sp. DSM 118148]|uniref:coproporphyrinogen-III oxidase family protein n=1 Tax=Streptomyces sp. DSM 118148 TaxID=3448667 RepID=UPI00403FF328